MRKYFVALALFAAVAALSAQDKKPEGVLTPQTPKAGDVIRRSVDLVTTDVIVRDGQGQFVADLSKGISKSSRTASNRSW